MARRYIVLEEHTSDAGMCIPIDIITTIVSLLCATKIRWWAAILLGFFIPIIIDTIAAEFKNKIFRGIIGSVAGVCYGITILHILSIFFKCLLVFKIIIMLFAIMIGIHFHILIDEDDVLNPSK